MEKKNIADIDLNQGTILRSFQNRIIGEGDDSADVFGVRIFEDGAAVSLAGAVCFGYFIRPDGITLVLSGSVSGNTAEVSLPSAAYAKEGNFTLAIKVSGSGYADTMRIVDGTVVNTSTGEIADPAQSVPSLQELLAVISDAEDAADAIEALSVSATQIEGTRYKISVVKEE